MNIHGRAGLSSVHTRRCVCTDGVRWSLTVGLADGWVDGRPRLEVACSTYTATFGTQWVYIEWTLAPATTWAADQLDAQLANRGAPREVRAAAERMCTELAAQLAELGGP